ncbi:RNA polymerase sigma factor [Luteolibacter marinus]|uniref:RNA polymerase sigma factor n=1 Tax=Luteolibacter marinus TaxID=2776705 RepID=UPI001867EA21|nr:sigma-70 family RNA polymerase sigma factor [Luteolibacter marinus]
MTTPPHFNPTRWTLVLRARGEDGEAKAALSDLCSIYYAPVVSFLRREGRGEDEARESAHGFFESVLAGGLGAPEPGRGRFRSYLLGALKHHLINQRAASVAGKRGGGAEHLELDDRSAISMDDRLAFDREWALAVIARSLATLEAEQADKPERFLTLKPWLGSGEAGSQADAARALGLSETAVKVAIHRLRARFREIIRTEIAATVDDPAEAADELRHLIAIASAG